MTKKPSKMDQNVWEIENTSYPYCNEYLYSDFA